MFNIDLDMEDREYMETSTLFTFVDESQMDVLLRIWKQSESNSMEHFESKFGVQDEVE